MKPMERFGMTKLQELEKLGQSVWLDFIHKAFIESGELHSLIGQGVRGVTSNPAIFEKSIAGSADYDNDIERLADIDKSAYEIYEDLAVQDVRRAAELLLPIYEDSVGSDGFVSLEVSPALAYDAEATVAEARRLFSAVGRPNIMIKIPATSAGILATESVVADGINVNVTLIFSLTQYQAAAQAYIRGLEKLMENGGALENTTSVASFFVSRLDSVVDPMLEEQRCRDLQGKIAVDNAKLAYALFREIFRGDRWNRIVGAGARLQRPLWASTGTKNPKYPDTLYVDNLIGPETVNTIPPSTIAAFIDHGHVALTLDNDLEASRNRLSQLAMMGIDLDSITKKLIEDGVEAFAQPFERLIESIQSKMDKLRHAQA
jgi:transaldolase